MREDDKSEIARMFCEVLEKQVFLFPESMAAADFTGEGDGYLVSAMTFRGKSRGGLMLAVPEAMAREMAANFLGLEHDDPFVETTCGDSLGEILNITCGHMLTALFGDREVFDLAAPRPFSLTGPEAAILSRKQGCLVFRVDGYQVLLQATFCKVPGEKPNAVH